MKIIDLDEELAVRLGDPATKGEDGIVFSAKKRRNYLIRAYSKLSRMLRILMRDYQPQFNRSKKVILYEIDPRNKQNNVIEISPFIKIDEVFVHYTYKDGNENKTGKAPAVYMSPDKYLSNKYGVNDIKEPTFADKKFKYTVMVDGSKTNLVLLPVSTASDKYTSVEVLLTPDLEEMNENTEIPITQDYVDMIINLAAIQGMQDIARADKAQLIEREIDKDWQILGQYGSYMKQVEGVEE